MIPLPAGDVVPRGVVFEKQDTTVQHSVLDQLEIGRTHPFESRLPAGVAGEQWKGHEPNSIDHAGVNELSCDRQTADGTQRDFAGGFQCLDLLDEIAAAIPRIRPVHLLQRPREHNPVLRADLLPESSLGLSLEDLPACRTFADP